MDKRKRLGRGIEDFSRLFLLEDSVEHEAVNHEERKRDVSRARKIAVVNGTKASNTPSLIANLAILLNRYKLKIALINPDLRKPNLDILMDSLPHTIHLSRDNLRDDLEKDSPEIRHVILDIDLSNTACLMEGEKRLIQERLNLLDNESDIVLIHLNNNSINEMRWIITYIGEFIVSTPPYQVGVLEAYSTIKKLYLINPDCRIGLIVEGLNEGEDGYRVYARINGVLKKYLNRSIHYLGAIPCEETNWGGMKDRRISAIIKPDSVYVRAIDEVAKGIASSYIEGEAFEQSMGLVDIFQRV